MTTTTTTTNNFNFDTIEKDCNAINVLFQTIINDMKGSPQIFEDFLLKTTKLHAQLKSTSIANTAFLESFQKIADLATGSKGVAKDIGTTLTRLCLRHRAIESKFRLLIGSLNESLMQPMGDRIEEWKKAIVYLDKEHSKENKKIRVDLKKKTSDFMRLHKKYAKKYLINETNKVDYKYESSLQELKDYYALLEETEKQHLRLAMIEERNQFTTFYKCIRPVFDMEIAMSNEISQIEDLVNNLNKTTSDSNLLPINNTTTTSAIEQIINDLKHSPDGYLTQLNNSITSNTSDLQKLNNNHNINNSNSLPSSPSSLSSRKSSVCSINSLSSDSSNSSSDSRSPVNLKFRVAQQQLIGGCINRLSSVSSQDSGFTSQEQFYLKSPHLMDDKDSNYKLAISCGTMKPWIKNGHHLHHHHHHIEGQNTMQTTSSSSKIITTSVVTTNTSDCCDMRHTVACLPADMQQHQNKTRPALSIHTFDPPDSLIEQQQNQKRTNGSLNNQSPNSIKTNSRLIPPPPQQQQQQQQNINMHKMRQRSTTLPHEVIAEGMKELMMKNSLQTNNSTGSNDTLLDEALDSNTDLHIQINPNKYFNSKSINFIENNFNSIDILSLNSYSSTSSIGSTKNSIKPAPPVRRNSSISTNHYSYQIENNYDDLASIHNFRCNEIQKSLMQQQQQQQTTPQPPAPPPPPPLPPPILTIPSQNNQFDDLPPPPESFYSDEYTISYTHTKQTQPKQQQPVKQTINVHQVLMSQIQYGVKLRPTNRQKT